MIKETHLAKGRSPPATLSSVYAGGLQYTTARCSPVSWAGTVCAGLDPACSLCLLEVVRAAEMVANCWGNGLMR